MFFSVELLDLLLYCVQQLGVMLAVGAETVLLIAYLVSTRDRKIDETEAHFSRAIHRALLSGLALMIASGAAIVWFHFSSGQVGILFEPVFLFKWLLIFALLLVYTTQKGKPFSNVFVEGAVGGSWYALFLIHILAPQTTWLNLIILYAMFVAGFVVLWSVIVSLSKERTNKVVSVATPETPKPKPLPPITEVPKTPAPKPAPVVSAPVVPPQPPPAPKPITPPPAVQTVEPHHSHWLPAIHVMPKDQKQLNDKAHITPLGSINKPV